MMKNRRESIFNQLRIRFLGIIINTYMYTYDKIKIHEKDSKY
jgi:hypothetical protein